MEIKKGISQMAEYPNVEINYVVPKNGNMYYVLKDGELENGVIIATLDPRHAIDEVNECSNVGAFSERGDVIVEFDKKSVKKITDELLLAVHSKPITDEVIDNLSKQSDEISKTAIEDNKKIVMDKLMEEMGDKGEFIFADPYSEANVYSTDSYNNKLGLDCSFIGKNEKGLYFHTSDINSVSKFIKVEEFMSDDISEDLNNVSESLNKEENISTEEIESEEESIVEEVSDVEDVSEIEEVNSDENEELKLDISQNILDGFKISEEELNKITPEEIESEMNEEVDMNKLIDTSDEDDNLEEEADEKQEEKESHDTDIDTDDEVFDNAIDVINKLIKETNKLNDKIKKYEEEIEKLETEISEKNKIIEEQEEKKDELNDLLSKANEVLDNIK